MTAGRGLVREAVEALPAYRGLTGARPPVRLDGNENPFGPSPRALAALAALGADAWSRYPAPERLRRRWARRLGVTVARVLLTSGSGPALALAAELTLDPGDACVLLAPSFELYAWAAHRREARVASVPCAPGRPFPGRAFTAALRDTRARLALVGCPDNPTGVAPTARWLAETTRRFPGTLFLVDEAYYEFFGRTTVGLTGRRANLLVTRTLSKAYGLAGARVGAVIGPAALIQRLHRINVPYPVTGAAAALGLAALDDEAHVRRTVRAARREAARMQRALSRLGLPTVRPRANFVLLDTRSPAAARRLVAALARRGIAVRDRSHLPGMAGIVRVSAGTPDETDRFIGAMRALRRRPARHAGRQA